MRIAALALAAALAVLSACTLQFGGGDDEPTPFPDPPQPPTPPGEKMLRCEDGKVRQLAVMRDADELSGHGNGPVIGNCPGGCRSASFACADDNCTGADVVLCAAPPASGQACALAGASCSGTATVACPQSTECGDSPGASCTCTGGTYACATDELAAVHARLAGKWRGMVAPPSFTTPYEVSLWIYPDGTYWAECARENCSAFYYGGDGPHPGRKITLLSASPVGPSATIGVFKGDPAGILSGLEVTDSRLRFTYLASWHSCAQPFFFDLARE